MQHALVRRFPATSLLALCLLFLSFAYAEEKAAVAEPVNPTAIPVQPAVDARINRNELLGHIKFLSSPELRGREAGTPEQLKAAQYVADEFKRFGLEPYGDTDEKGVRSYFQDFPITVSKGALAESALVLKSGDKEKKYELGKDFAPFPMGDKKASAESGVVFAGYSIIAPEHSYDDFGDLDLAGKWVLILRYEPQEKDSKSNFDGKEHSKYAALVSKIMNCVMRRAAGVVIVTGPAGREKEPDTVTDSKGALMGEFSIPVLQITRKTADELLEPSGKKLGDLQAAIDKDLSNHSFELKDVKLSGVSALDLDRKKTSNIIARLPGRDGKLRKEHVVIGAHTDHVGLGWQNSLLGKEGRNKIHPGADDNASGTAGLLEIAQHYGSLKEGDRPRRSILFIGFTGEESGLLGSQYYLRNTKVPLADTIAMLNLDMIGRSATGDVQVAGVGTAKGFKDLVLKHTKNAKFANDEGMKVHLGSSGTGPSDHAAFFEKKIPVLFFFTGIHPDYHRPSDTWEKINAPVAEAVADLARKLLFEIADNKTRPEFIAQSAQGFLGVSPDNSKKDAKGYLVGQVVPDSPAAQAGIKAGDLITNINGQHLSNAMDLNIGLIDFSPGDSVDLTGRRGDETLQFKVKLGTRSAEKKK
ncbi:MAG TPA: M28 family peptidase [Planctomycetota bacterium]|nr:M28 family peptidase [Planctomycetota bacterium]